MRLALASNPARSSLPRTGPQQAVAGPQQTRLAGGGDAAVAGADQVLDLFGVHVVLLDVRLRGVRFGLAIRPRCRAARAGRHLPGCRQDRTTCAAEPRPQQLSVRYSTSPFIAAKSAA